MMRPAPLPAGKSDIAGLQVRRSRDSRVLTAAVSQTKSPGIARGFYVRALLRRQRNQTFPLIGFDRHDLVAGRAFVDVDERTQSDPGQFAQPERGAPAAFATRRQANLCEHYGHDAQSLTLTTKHAE